MTYATLMVHLDLGTSNEGRLRIAGDLATRFDAAVIGIAACQTMPVGYDGSYVSGDLIEDDRRQKAKEMREAEAQFRNALGSRVGTLEWRAAMLFGPASEYLASEARSADLVITGVTSTAWLDPSRCLNAGDLVMQVGRPVLIVPTAAASLQLERIVIGWKDTRETRRAVADALPLLKKAARVLLVEIAREGDLKDARLQHADVLAWLSRHGVKAESAVLPSLGDDATRLRTIAREDGADVFIAGAYGHSRVREWALGGVTRDLLTGADRCTLVSH